MNLSDLPLPVWQTLNTCLPCYNSPLCHIFVEIFKSLNQYWIFLTEGKQVTASENEWSGDGLAGGYLGKSDKKVQGALGAGNAPSLPLRVVTWVHLMDSSGCPRGICTLSTPSPLPGPPPPPSSLGGHLPVLHCFAGPPKTWKSPPSTVTVT